MKSKFEEKNKAIELRKSGLTFGEIQKTVPVSKGLLSGWLKNLELSEPEKLALKNHGKDLQDRGRLRAAITNKYKHAQRENTAIESAKKRFAKLKNDSAFLVGISLYWAEGSKQTGEFQFVNSDPDMLLFMLSWIQKYLAIEKSKIKARLFLHRKDEYEKYLAYWSELLEIDSSLFQKTFQKNTRKRQKSLNYKGSLSLSIPGINNLRTMKTWQKLLATLLLK